MRLQITPLQARDFTWTGRHGISEASDLGFRCGQVPYQRLYDDACDVGVDVHNPNTGMTKTFVMTNVDNYGWNFEEVYNRRDENYEPLTLHILND